MIYKSIGSIKQAKKAGFGGVHSPDGDCACEFDDFAPCDESPDDCILGKKVECLGNASDPTVELCCGDCNFHIVSGPTQEGT